MRMLSNYLCICCYLTGCLMFSFAGPPRKSSIQFQIRIFLGKRKHNPPVHCNFCCISGCFQYQLGLRHFVIRLYIRNLIITYHLTNVHWFPYDVQQKSSSLIWCSSQNLWQNAQEQDRNGLHWWIQLLSYYRLY